MQSLHPSDTGLADWAQRLREPEGIKENHGHFWGNDPAILCSSSVIEDFISGTGEDIFTKAIIPLLLSAKQEVILVTCFWAASPSLSKLSSALVELSRKIISQRLPRIRVRLCFSSRSLWQKMFHTTSPKGESYQPSKWVSKLGLPSPDLLQGLDLQIKSLFFLPFSVLHPKFVIVDRKVALLPSCNVSFELWLECCLKVSGPVVDRIFAFWAETWETDKSSRSEDIAYQLHPINPVPYAWSTLLPSQHHRAPRFRPLSLQAPAPPQTPLNTYLLYAISNAKESIDITTPNLTCGAVISALLEALARGVDVHLMTCRRMMVFEQLVTAGTLTELCVWRMARQHGKLLSKQGFPGLQKHWSRSTRRMADIEHARTGMGRLHISYFKPQSGKSAVKCHIKCSIIDNTVVVLGSGNMDRASWFTSQELGIALEDEDAVRRVMLKLNEARKGSFDDRYNPT